MRTAEGNEPSSDQEHRTGAIMDGITTPAKAQARLALKLLWTRAAGCSRRVSGGAWGRYEQVRSPAVWIFSIHEG